MLCEEFRRKSLKRRIQLVTQVGLDTLRGADRREARAEAGQPVRGGQRQDDGGIAGERSGRAVAREGVDGVLDRPRDGQGKARGRGETERAERIARAIPRDGVDEGACGRGQPRLPAACGLRAA
jgi:hypothetical protein